MIQCDLKKANYSAMTPDLFLVEINTEWEVLIGFSYSSKPVGFRAISMSCLNFLIQATYPGEFSRLEVV